ncbi:MAG: hypothetical protein H7Y31_00550 [Chitinophagaceae bacterium]|nr:hypothetical protein [Chitinophagaceae bacterium]
MKMFFTLTSAIAFLFLFPYNGHAQTSWPKIVTTSEGSTIKMYEWQPESSGESSLKARAAISVIENGKADPVFGVAWFTAALNKTSNGYIVESVEIQSIKLPGDRSDEQLEQIERSLEAQVPAWKISFTNDEINSDLKLNQQQESLSKNISNAPPQIIYSTQPSILVSIDGDPKLKKNEEWGVEAVVNSPFTIIKNRDGNFYLYGGKHWYEANAATGPYKYTQQVPSNLTSIESAINDSYKNNNNTDSEENSYTISSIVVTTKPAELVQTEGEASFAAVEGTNLLYVKNTDDDIFMDVNSQNYYVLLAGRWYKSKTLSGQWQFVESDKLPQDFARIPAKSEKADVLSSVAGTDEATDAIQEAQLPQTAKVDRNSATVDVVYDGDPEFQDIDGTSMQYAVNTPNSVLRYRNQYYSVDNGVWFVARSARGPWAVAVERPYEIALIPPRYPVYHVKYVYIYDVQPDYVYMGYTPGYLNTYVYGPTVVYGTGYYYRPWYRTFYYPRPCTWGYNMRYSPYGGWGFGVNINFGWLNVGIGSPWWGYSRAGWWGPSAYRPNYCYRGGYYGYNNRYYGYNGNQRNNVYNNNRYYNSNPNIYNNRRGISSRDIQRNDNRRRDIVNNNGNRRNDGNRIERNYNNRDYNNNNNNRPDINRGNNGNNNNRNNDINNNNRGNGGRDANRIGNGTNNNSRPSREYRPSTNNDYPERNRNNRIINENRGSSPDRTIERSRGTEGGRSREIINRPDNSSRGNNGSGNRAPERSNDVRSGGNNGGNNNSGNGNGGNSGRGGSGRRGG